MAGAASLFANAGRVRTATRISSPTWAESRQPSTRSIAKTRMGITRLIIVYGRHKRSNKTTGAITDVWSTAAKS